MPVKLTVERQTLSFDTDAIGIGRDPDNQVALPNDSRLAPLHAVLRFVNGRWIVESRDGGTIRVNNGRPVRFAWLNPGDVILLTESGPELTFEPGTLGVPSTGRPPTVPLPSLPSLDRATASTTVPYIPFIPDMQGATEQPGTKQPVRVSEKPKKSLPRDTSSDSRVAGRQMALVGISALLGFVVIGGWAIFNWTRRPTELRPVDQPQAKAGVEPAVISMPATVVATAPVPAPATMVAKAPASAPVSAPTPTPTPVFAAAPVPEALVGSTPAKEALDPREFLVLVGIGDLKTDDRPHVLGVGWLWDQRTAVTSRSVGVAIAEVASETLREGNPRQGCVIQGMAFEVEQVIQPEGCPEIAILRLKYPAELPLSAREQWKKIGAAGIERSRALGKPINYFSYGSLPRPESVKGNHGFPLCEYDPDSCHLRHDEARFVYQQPQHFLKPDTAATKLERGGLLVDDDRKIIGMVPLNSPIVWTETLERAFDFRTP